jgi:hypothetical protein
MAFVPIVWPEDPRVSLTTIYASRSVRSIVPNQGRDEYLTFGQSNKRALQLDEVGTPAHTANPYIDDAGNGQHNHDARIPDGWELFGPTLGLQNPPGGVAQCIIKIADRDRILYIPPREKVPQQWIAVNIESRDLPDLFDQGWTIYEVPYVGGGRIFVTLVKSPPPQVVAPEPAVPDVAPAPVPAALNIPQNVPRGGRTRRKRNRSRKIAK